MQCLSKCEVLCRDISVIFHLYPWYISPIYNLDWIVLWAMRAARCDRGYALGEMFSSQWAPNNEPGSYHNSIPYDTTSLIDYLQHDNILWLKLIGRNFGFLSCCRMKRPRYCLGVCLIHLFVSKPNRNFSKKLMGQTAINLKYMIWSGIRKNSISLNNFTRVNWSLAHSV